MKEKDELIKIIKGIRQGHINTFNKMSLVQTTYENWFSAGEKKK